MPPKSTLWLYFCTNKTWYKGDKTHNNAWCKGCIASYVNEWTQADTLTLTEPSPSPPWWILDGEVAKVEARTKDKGEDKGKGRYWSKMYSS
jgi:hypothetical protein